jgi:hypothetical protein
MRILLHLTVIILQEVPLFQSQMKEQSLVSPDFFFCKISSKLEALTPVGMFARDGRRMFRFLLWALPWTKGELQGKGNSQHTQLLELSTQQQPLGQVT